MPSEVLAQVNQSIVRINGEHSKGPARVTETDKEQWDKVVCCVAATAQVYQVNVQGRLPKDARMIVSAKPQHDSRPANGFSLYADSAAIFYKPDSTKAGNVDMSANVMFYQASDDSSDHKSNGRVYVYREGSVNKLDNICRDLVNKQLTVVPFAPNPGISWLYDEKQIAKRGSPWQTKYQLENEDRVPHAGAFLEFDSHKDHGGCTVGG